MFSKVKSKHVRPQHNVADTDQLVGFHVSGQSGPAPEAASVVWEHACLASCGYNSARLSVGRRAVAAQPAGSFGFVAQGVQSIYLVPSVVSVVGAFLPIWVSIP